MSKQLFHKLKLSQKFETTISAERISQVSVNFQATRTSHPAWTGSHPAWTGGHPAWTGSHPAWTGKVTLRGLASHPAWTGGHPAWTGFPYLLY